MNLTLTDKKEMAKYIDDFLYHMEDNFGLRMETNPQLVEWGLNDICNRLNDIWLKLDEQISLEEKSE